MKKYKSFIDFILTSVFLYAFYFYIKDNIELIDSVSSINPKYFVIFILFSFFIYLVKSIINIYIYSFSKLQLSILESFQITSKIAAINLSSPVNLGAGYKLHYLKKKYGLNISENFSVNIAYTYYLNYFYIIIIFLVVLFSNQRDNFLTVYLNLSLLSVIFILFLFLKLTTSNKLAKVKLPILKNNIGKLTLGFRYFKQDTKNTRNLFISSIVYIVISVIYFKTIMSSVGFNISLFSLLILFCLTSLVNLIKLTPGNIGFLEISLIFFQSLHGVGTNQIIIFSVISRIVSFVTLLLFFGFDKFLNKN